MKKFIITIFVIIVLLVAAIFIFPGFFKSNVINFIDGKLAEKVEATISYDHDRVKVSLIKDFPNISLGLHDLAIVGRGQFSKDTLLAAKEFYVSVDIKSVFTDRMSLKKIFMEEGLISIVFAKNGAANYDIFPPSEATETDSIDSADDFEIAFDHWELNNSRIVYKDFVYNMFMTLSGVNHTGDGDFAKDVFDMVTYSKIASVSFDYDGLNYMKNKEVEGDLIMKMDLNTWVFTFKENNIRINDFGFAFEGFFALLDLGYDMDVNFKTTNNTFKSFLSVIPGMYAEGFDELDTRGSLAFDGRVKGLYTDDKFPAWDINLQVKDGYIKAKDIPVPMEKISLDLHTSSKNGEMNEGVLQIKNFGLSMDGEQFHSKVDIADFDNPKWDISLKGALNMGLISRIMPAQDFSLTGRINADVNSKGLMSDLESEQYQKLYSAGSINFDKFAYTDEEIGTFNVSRANLSFDPQYVGLSNFAATWGNSDFILNGRVTNYMAYLLKGETIKGNLKLVSKKLDINEMMSSTSPAIDDAEADTTGLYVFSIPKNIDITFDAQVNRVIYDTYDIRNLRGQLLAQRGVLNMNGLNFNMFGGSVAMNGMYDPSELDAPLFTFDLDIKKMGIKDAYENFVTVQKLMPIAENMSGTFSTKFKIGGLLEQNMLPDYSSLTGKGVITLEDAALTDSHIIGGINKLANLGSKASNNVRLKDLRIRAEIENGRFYVEPFVVNIGQYATTVGGSTGIDGSLDYLLAMNIPSGQAGQAFNQAVSGIIGSKFTGGENVVMNFNMGGTYRNPDIKLGKVEAGGGAKSAIKQSINDKIEEEKAHIKSEIDKHRAEAEEKARKEAERLKKEAEKRAEEEKEKLKEQAKNKLKNIIGG